MAGSSVALPAAPPTRGWTLNEEAQQAIRIGCPAYAGMDPCCALGYCACERLPRLRGDGPLKIAVPDGVYWAAPPTRGWTPERPRHWSGSPGCPAYAGMDPLSILTTRLLTRLPRLRGDGPQEGLTLYGIH